MHLHLRRSEAASSHCFLNPEQYVVARSVLVVSEVMVEANLVDLTPLEERDDLFWPSRSYPALWDRPLII